LLGNLLCAVANLLNANGPLSNLVNLLNQILLCYDFPHITTYYRGGSRPLILLL